MSWFVDLPTARATLTDLQRQLSAAGIRFRDPPPEPGSCCGRGCNGCVWEGYYAAATYWCDEAKLLLDGATGVPHSGDDSVLG